MYSNLRPHSNKMVPIPPTPNNPIYTPQNPLGKSSSRPTPLCSYHDSCFPVQYAVMEGTSPRDKMRGTYWDAPKTNWAVWPVIQAGNFWVVPVQYRVFGGQWG